MKMYELLDKVIESKNKEARKTNPCINPKCKHFVEIQNRYNICIKCFSKVVKELKSIHKVFDYSTNPPTRRMTSNQMKSLLERIERKNQETKNENSRVLTGENGVIKNVQ